MPIFDFQCKQCSKIVEALARFAEVVICSECGCPMEKLVSRPAAPPRSGELIASARSQASREGHFSNYSPAERSRKR